MQINPPVFLRDFPLCPSVVHIDFKNKDMIYKIYMIGVQILIWPGAFFKEQILNYVNKNLISPYLKA